MAELCNDGTSDTLVLNSKEDMGKPISTILSKIKRDMPIAEHIDFDTVVEASLDHVYVLLCFHFIED